MLPDGARVNLHDDDVSQASWVGPVLRTSRLHKTSAQRQVRNWMTRDHDLFHLSGRTERISGPAMFREPPVLHPARQILNTW